jgi:hypothetical protein
MNMRGLFFSWLVIGAIAGAGCSTRMMMMHGGDTGGAVDANVGVDAPIDDGGAIDGGAHDGGPRDAGPHDGGRDGGHDAGRDVGPASMDAGHDAAPSVDTGPRPDAGRCPGGARIGLYATDDALAHVTVHDFLVGTGVLGSVTIGGPLMDMPGPPPVPARVPTLSELMAYDALFVWGSGSWNGDAIGNVLADYVDAGGGVVIAVFAQRTGASVGVEGRMLSAGYLPYVPGDYSFAPLTMGTPTMPGHPILMGVTTVSGTNIANHVGAIAPGSTLIVPWNDGTPLISTLEPSNGRTALVGMYPVRFWDTATQGARLMANALLWAARCN